MQTKRLVLLIFIAALAVALFALNRIALDNYYYWLYWWYDIMMHFLGGCIVGGLAAWAALRRDESLSLRQTLIFTLASIVVIGVGWELFEYFTGQYVGQQGIVLDTTLDLVMDTLGALTTAAILYALSVKRTLSVQEPMV